MHRPGREPRVTRLKKQKPQRGDRFRPRREPRDFCDRVAGSLWGLCQPFDAGDHFADAFGVISELISLSRQTL